MARTTTELPPFRLPRYERDGAIHSGRPFRQLLVPWRQGQEGRKQVCYAEGSGCSPGRREGRSLKMTPLAHAASRLLVLSGHLRGRSSDVTRILS